MHFVSTISAGPIFVLSLVSQSYLKRDAEADDP